MESLPPPPERFPLDNVLVITTVSCVTSELKYLTMDPRCSHMSWESKVIVTSHIIPLRAFWYRRRHNSITFNQASYKAFPFCIPNFEITVFLLTAVGFPPNQQAIELLIIMSKSRRRNRMLLKHEFGDYKAWLTQRQITLLFYKWKVSYTFIPMYFLSTQRIVSGTYFMPSFTADVYIEIRVKCLCGIALWKLSVSSRCG